MIIDSGISHYYRVDVSYPADVFCLIMERYERGYLQDMDKVTAGCISSGSSCYAECVEWATFQGYEDAQRARDKMKDVIAEYADLVGAT